MIYLKPTFDTLDVSDVQKTLECEEEESEEEELEEAKAFEKVLGEIWMQYEAKCGKNRKKNLMIWKNPR